MGNCVGNHVENYNFERKEFDKRKSSEFGIELDMCEKRFANSKNQLFVLDNELNLTRKENEKLRQKIHSLIQEQSSHIKLVKRQEKINATRAHRKFFKDQIVFVLDRSYQPGHTRPLKSPYSPSPYRVLQVNPVTALVERLADNYQQIYSNSDIKPFNSLSAEFSNLPLEVLQIVKMPLEQHSPLTQKILLKYDPLLINDSAIDINNNLDNDTSPDSDISSKNLSENSHISTKAQNQTNAANNSAASSEIRNNFTKKLYKDNWDLDLPNTKLF